ncbi:MAG: helix-turn-helix transcriptional regulator [Cyanobacteria bacterium P01_F01_bin.150]
MANYTQELRSLMAQANIPSFHVLAQQANVSSWYIHQIRQGRILQLRLGTLLRISKALNISVETLTDKCSGMSLVEANEAKKALPPQQTNLQLEYKRLKDQLESQEASLKHSFQRTSLQVLESWMTYWPAATHAAQSNANLPATRLIPLVRPVELLLKQWGVEVIASVGAELPYDPKQHQLLEGQANPGDLVRVSNPGYWHEGALVQRVKVKPL